MRVLVCGSRDWDDALLFDILDALHDDVMFDVVIEGEAKGADTDARLWATSRLIPVEKYPADWEGLGKAAGPHRNRQMLEDGKPDLVVAFKNKDESRGTNHMLNIAREAGVRTIEVIVR